MAVSKGGAQLIPVPAVPEIAITENDHASRAEHQIRVARQLGDVFSVADAQLPQLPAQEQFVARILLSIRPLRA